MEVRRAETQTANDGFRQMIDLIPALAWSCRPDGSAGYFNRGWLEYTGLSAQEASEWGWTRAFHLEDVDRVVAYWKLLLANPVPGEIEARLRRFDGEYRWFLFRIRPLCDESGRLIAWYGTNTDIEDRKRVEDALRASERELRQLVDSVPGVIATANSKGQHDYANRRALDYTGTSAEDSWDLGFIHTIHPDEQELVRAEWLRCSKLGVPMDLKHRWRRFDGVYRWFHVRVDPLLDDQGRIVRWYGLLTDIDDQIRAEETLRKREQELRLLVEAIPAFIWRATPQGRLEYVNQRVLDYTGVALEDLQTQGWAPLIHSDDAEAAVQSWRDHCEAGPSYEVTFRVRRLDGEYRWFHVHGEPLRGPDGSIVQWYGLMIDIHDRKQMEEALQNTRRSLSLAMQVATVAEMSASIAHEINQPLAAVVANAHACVAWLSSDPPNLERAKLTAERIIRDGNSTAEVVSRIRALFKQAQPAMAASDINQVIAEALQLIADEVREYGVSVQTDLARGLPLLVVDRVQLQQAIINLAHNAIEAMAGVTAWPRMLSVVSRREGERVLIQVRDTGCGIDAGQPIFEPFFTTKEQGMGMGLAICRSIIEAHGGSLCATPNNGPGTTFSFTLPVDSDTWV